MTKENQRHIPADELLALIGKGKKEIFAYVNELPRCRLEVVPNERSVEVQVHGDESVVSVSKFRHLRPSRKQNEEGEWNCLSISWSHSPAETFAFAASIVDRVQLQKETLATATEEGIRGFQEVLRQEPKLTTEQEVGLYGELLVLEALSKSIGSESALKSWLGPENEEHDFGLPNYDLEVKTTTQESRTHWISSATQLQPRPGIQLRLVSIQLTPKFLGDGLTLPELVLKVELGLGGHSAAFWQRLDEVGLKKEQFGLYSRQWALRSEVREFIVEGDFPRVTPLDLAKIGLDRPEIPEFRYRIVLQDQIPAEPVLSIEKAFESLIGE